MKTLLIDFDKKFKNKNRIIISKNDLNKIFLNSYTKYHYYEYEKVITHLYLNYPTFKRWINHEPPFDNFIKFIFNFYDFLKINNIHTIISNASIPHHLEELVIEISTNLLNIKIIYFYPLYFLNQHSSYPNCIPIIKSKNQFNLNILRLKTTNLKFDKYFDTSINFYEKNDRNKKNTIGSNYYISIIYLLFQSLRLKKKLDNIFVKDKFINNFYYLNNQKKSINFYNKNIVKKIPKKRKSIVYLSHFQPEASSWPLGGYLNNQLHLMLILRSFFPDYDIYYKEHYKSFVYFQKKIGFFKVGKYRNIDYYQEMINNKIKFIDINNNKVNLDSDLIIVTMTGNIALKRALCGLPTIITGFPWYKELNLDGIFHISDIDNIKKNYFKKSLFNYIKNKRKILNIINNNCLKVKHGKIDENDAINFVSEYENTII